MVLAFQRALRRLRAIVRGSRPGTGHETTIDGHPVTAWRGWDRATGQTVEALRVECRDADEVTRLARAYFGPSWIGHEIRSAPGEAVIWRTEQTIHGTPPPPLQPFARRTWDPRMLTRGIGQPTPGLMLGRFAIEAVQE